MTGANIKRRLTKKGDPRYLVYYRRGTKFKEKYAGSFATKAEARIRRDVVAGEIAAGRDPADWLAAAKTPPEPPKPPPSLDQQWEAFIDSRIDVHGSTVESYTNARNKWVPILGADIDPHTVAIRDVIDGIAEMHDGGDGLSPNTIRQYHNKLAMVLDYCDVEPNPARSRKVKLPKNRRSAIQIPETRAWFAIRNRLKKRSLLALRLTECCGLRVSECANLTWGNIDFGDGRLLIADTKTDAGRRWIPVPTDLLDEIADLLEPEERPADMTVFGVNPNNLRYDLERACITAAVGNYSPHELRHRRSSLWYRHGIDPITVKGWLGHTRASMGLDVYGHVVLDPREDEWRDFWLEVSSGAPSRHQDEIA